MKYLVDAKILLRYMMNILINFSTLKSGGGQNIAMNFLYAYNNLTFTNINIFYFVAKNSEPHKFLQKIDANNYYVLPKNPIKRIFFEKFLSYKILNKLKIDIIYTYFGYGFFPKRYLQVSGVAVSNIFFPEIDFWAEYNKVNKIKKYLIDQYRIYGIKNAHALVFENESMLQRAKKLYNLNRVVFIKQSVNFNFQTDKLNFRLKKSIYKGLFLCGWQYNKNILIIPELAYLLKTKNINFVFVITASADNNNEIYKKFKFLVNKYNVEDMIDLIGTVKKSELADLYNKIDYVFLLSRLESFSNNIIEAWYFEKPLIVSNLEWARSICKESALYVERDDARNIVSGIEKLINNKSLVKKLISNGSLELKYYPSIEEKITQEISYIKEVYEANL